MSLRSCYRGLVVAIFLSFYVESAPVPPGQHDEESRGESDAIAVAAAAGSGPECRVSVDCVSDPLRTLTKAMPHVRPGDTLNLRGNAFYPPRTAFSFSGTREKPITVQAYIEPYAVFDGGYPELREAPNDAWERVPGDHPEE